MADDYLPHKIEAKWRARWSRERGSFVVESGADPYYVLDMIAYPSSEGLHMGHWRPYTIADVWARYQTMTGRHVLSPVGFDAFGLPAENAAIKDGTPPAVYTRRSINNFTRQINDMGKMYDWSTYLNTSDPSYYRWTQWLFLQLYQHGLAYRHAGLVNWCPGCQTVLANEQVIAGQCERCHTAVAKKNLPQWYLKITDFAEELLDFDGLEWPERVKTAQINWIGRKIGTEIKFGLPDDQGNIAVFTTRSDTLMGVTYLVLAPEHPAVEAITTPEAKDEVKRYLVASAQKSDIERQTTEREKAGVFTGAYARHPITGEKIAVWIADYVIATAGTGAVMGVPAHDERDFEFARRNRLPIRFVIRPTAGEADEGRAFTGLGVVVNSGRYNGLSSQVAMTRITTDLETAGRGRAAVSYRLRDWLVSRQRYWGTPIPIIYCDKCGQQPVRETDLPVLLPEDMEFLPRGGSLLAHHPTFSDVKCPNCGGSAKRETDTLDTFVDSSWYYLRFTDPANRRAAWNSEQVKRWLPVDFYVGGVEHSILHLLYARFIMRAMFRLGLVPYSEPFETFFGNGMVYYRGHKMSKSKGNVVNPDVMVKRHGADALRGYILFMGPADQDVEWRDQGISGITRFLGRAWTGLINVRDSQDVSQAVKQSVGAVTGFIKRREFNRAISALMIAFNSLPDGPTRADGEILCRLLAPFFPHFAEEVWERFGHPQSIFRQPWPDAAFQDESPTVTYAVQINGKLRATLVVPKEANQPDVVAKARTLGAVKSRLDQGNMVSTVFVPRKIVNFVIQL